MVSVLPSLRTIRRSLPTWSKRSSVSGPTLILTMLGWTSAKSPESTTAILPDDLAMTSVFMLSLVIILLKQFSHTQTSPPFIIPRRQATGEEITYQYTATTAASR